MPDTYINTTCKVGQSVPCGEPATFVIAVTEVADTAWATEGRLGGVVGLCDRHARTAVADWDTDTCTCGDPTAYSLNPAEVVVHCADGPCYVAAAEGVGGGE